MLFALRVLLNKIATTGDLTIIDASGSTSHFGDGAKPTVELRIRSRHTERRLALDPELSLGECYMAGELEFTRGDIYDLLTIVMRKPPGALPTWIRAVDRLRIASRRARQFNTSRASARNVAHHYDIDDDIYRLFLDSDRQYSCAYFTTSTDLEQAQHDKKRHLAAKLALRPGHRVLDIGCGWGGLGLYLAQHCQANVTGITLSREQLAVAVARANHASIDRGRAQFELVDYRQITGAFDRIVSVGMFEHVGVNHYRTYFNRVRELLAPDGVALIHTIARSDGPGYTNPFIARYIFPGGYFPAHSEVMAAVERSGLLLTDVEVLRLHYAETLKSWRERFMANRAQAVALRGESFARMWEFYLAGSEVAFRHQGLVVLQLQLAKAVDTLPITRDYMLAAERRLAMLDGGRAEQPRMAGE
jgi:cyclopropane-fatty-acyl-phospholipid synthase